MFDMTRCKVGDKLLMRCGANATFIKLGDDGVICWAISPWGVHSFDLGGSYLTGRGDHDYDIVGWADGLNESATNITRHRAALDRLAETYAKKNADYGDSFSKSIDRRGYVAALTRMDDKMERLDQLLINGHAANYESALDSALDLANYAIMLAMYLEAHK